MARPKEIDGAVRQDCMISLSQKNALKELSLKTGFSMSQLIRQAIGEFLKMTEETPPKHSIPGTMKKVLRVFEYIAPMLGKGSIGVELPFETLMLNFEMKWSECKNLIRAFCSMLEIKGIDVIWEPIYDQVPIPGSDRERFEKIGFTLSFDEPMSKDKLLEIKEHIEDEYMRTGKLDGNGRSLADY